MISPAMQAALKGPRRSLCWMFYVQGSGTGDLYAWSGMHKITWDGQEYLGVGHVMDMSTIKKSETVSHTQQDFTLNGLDPGVLGGLELSVRGKVTKVWLGGLDTAGQVISDPILISELVQDTLQFTRSADDVLALNLSCFEALPFVGRARQSKYSHESQLALFADDVGFEDIVDIANTGPSVEWRIA